MAMKSLFLLSGLVGVLFLGGCTCSRGGVSYAEGHTSLLWKTDREASIELLKQRYPEEAELFDGVEFHELNAAVYDVVLELQPEERYILSVRFGSDNIYVSKGSWTRYEGAEESFIRLQPDTLIDSEMPEAPAFVQSLIISVEDSGNRAMLLDILGRDTVLKGLD